MQLRIQLIIGWTHHLITNVVGLDNNCIVVANDGRNGQDFL
jgi:hypothetical protein